MDDQSPASPRRLEKIAEVSRRIGFQKSWIYERLATGDHGFPAPLKIGSATRWDSRAIDAWIEAQAAGGEAGAGDAREVGR